MPHDGLRGLTRQIGVAFLWTRCFDADAAPIAVDSLLYERASIEWNIMAHYANLAYSESRRDAESIRRALLNFQLAAGVLQHIGETLSDSLMQTAGVPDEYRGESIEALQMLMLAQAQEGVWQKGVLDGLKDTTIARLARSTADLYEASLSACDKHAGASAFLRPWVGHIRYKQCHFAAVAQYRKSCDDLAQKRYGDELGRLEVAMASVNTAQRVPSRNLPLQSITSDLQSLHSIIQTNQKRAEKDNQLVYLEPTTAPGRLPDIGTAVMVKPMVPQELQDPVAWLKQQQQPESAPWFARLLTYGIDVAVRIYSDRKKQYLDTVLDEQRRSLDRAAEDAISAMNVRPTLERLSTPRRAPPECVRLTEELDRSGGSRAFRTRIQRAEQLVGPCADILRRTEAQLFTAHPGLSAERVALQQELQAQWREYEHTLSQASASDAIVRERIAQLQPVLDAHERGQDVCGSLLAKATQGLESVQRSMQPQLRALRTRLELVQDMSARRHSLLLDARARAEGDDIRSQLIQAERERRWSRTQAPSPLPAPKTAPALRLPEAVEPAQLEDVLLHAMDQYTRYSQELENSGAQQERELQEVEVRVHRVQFVSLTYQRLKRTLFAQQPVAGALDAYAAAVRQISDVQARVNEVALNLEEGARFYMQLLEMLRAWEAKVTAWANWAPMGSGAGHQEMNDNGARVQHTEAPPADHDVSRNAATDESEHVWGAFPGGAIRFDQ